jgi:hypothetical protein
MAMFHTAVPPTGTASSESADQIHGLADHLHRLNMENANMKEEVRHPESVRLVGPVRK